MLLSENIVSKQKHSEEYNSFKSDIKDMLVFMRERFEAIDRRFDDMNQRFSMMFKFFTVGFVILATMMSVFQFPG